MVLLDCGEEQAALGDLYFLELTQGLQEALLASGYGPVISATRATLAKWVGARAVHGVVLAAGADRRRLAREIAERGTPCVVVANRSVEEIPGVGWVYLDLDSGGRAAARMLLDRGHRRIGCIGNSDSDFVREAFAEELRAARVPLQPEFMVIAGAGREAGAGAMRRMLNCPNPPTAVFARTDVLASGALQAARQLGVRVPQQLSLMGHDDIPLAKSIGLTTVRIDCGRLGRAAADVLVGLHEGSVREPVPIVCTQVVVRNTVAGAP